MVVTKAAGDIADLSARLTNLGARAPIRAPETGLADIILDVMPVPRTAKAKGHVGYVTWRHESDLVLDRRALGDKLAERPEGLYRLKGFVLTNGGAYEIHVVGRNVEARRTEADRTQLVALAPQGRLSKEEIEAWWQA